MLGRLCSGLRTDQGHEALVLLLEGNRPRYDLASALVLALRCNHSVTNESGQRAKTHGENQQLFPKETQHQAQRGHRFSILARASTVKEIPPVDEQMQLLCAAMTSLHVVNPM